MRGNDPFAYAKAKTNTVLRSPFGHVENQPEASSSGWHDDTGEDFNFVADDINGQAEFTLGEPPTTSVTPTFNEIKRPPVQRAPPLP
jgi:hypothetical protein